MKKNEFIDKLKDRCQNDFYFFAKEILNYQGLSYIHESWCKELQDLSIKRKLDLEPRGTYKSTVKTMAYTLWRLINNPELRILIANATDRTAIGFLREIKSHITRNKMFKYIFGDWYNKKKWTEKGIVLKNRKGHKKDMSVVCSGIGGNVTGQHYDIIICDDLVNEKDRDYERFRERSIRYYEELISVLEPEGWLFVIGTRWHFFDLYNHIIQNLNPPLIKKGLRSYKIKIQSAIDSNGQPTFPDILSLSKLEELKIEKGIQFYSQYLNNPLPEGQALFPLEKLHFFDEKTLLDLSSHEIYGFCDPAIGESSKASRTAIITLAKHKNTGKLYVIDSFIQRIDPDMALLKIFKLNEKYHYTRFGYETNMHLSYWFKKLKHLNEINNIYLPLVGISQKMKKETRIEGIEPLVNDGTISFIKDYKDNPMYNKLIEELIYYPRGETVDGIDSLESCVRVARALSKPVSYKFESESKLIDWDKL